MIGHLPQNFNEYFKEMRISTTIKVGEVMLYIHKRKTKYIKLKNQKYIFALFSVI